MNILAALATPVELILLILAVALFFNRHGVGIAESLALAITGALSMLSLLLQTMFLAGIPQLTAPVEIGMLLVSAYCIWCFRSAISDWKASFIAVFRRYPGVSMPWGLALLYLALQALLLPDGNYDSMRYNLARVLIFSHEHSLFPNQITEYHQAVLPVGGDILTYLPLRFYTDYGLALFSFFAYVGIMFSSYAWARKHALPEISFTTALIISSLPLIVYQSTGTKPDILSVMAALACVLLFYRLLSEPSCLWLALFLLFLGFGLSAKTTFLAFAVPLLLLFLFIRFRSIRSDHRLRIGLRFWPPLLAALLIFSQAWLFVHNRVQWGGWFGPPAFVQSHRNSDGFEGAQANLVRYLLQSLHLLSPVDIATQKLSGMRPSESIRLFYNDYVHPVWGDKGIAPGFKRLPFEISGSRRWGDDENSAWFGPLGFFLILPAMLFALLRGEGALRIVVGTLFLYVAAICYFIGWMPWNGRFIAMFYVCSGGAVALLLVRASAGAHFLKGLRLFALAIMLYALAFNQQKELLGARGLLESLIAGHLHHGVFQQSIWLKTDFGRDRDYYVRRFYGDDRVNIFAEKVEKGATVGIYARYLTWLFPYLQKRPDVHFIPLAVAGSPESSIATMNLEKLGYLLCLNSNCNAVIYIVGDQVLWQARHSPGVIDGALIKLHE